MTLKKEDQLLVTLKVEDLKILIRESVEEIISKNLPRKIEDKLLCRKDVARLLSVSLVTVSTWMKSEKLPYHRIGSRIFFKESEVMGLLTQK